MLMCAADKVDIQMDFVKYLDINVEPYQTAASKAAFV